MRMPAIADAEIHRLGAPKQLGIGWLISSGKFIDWTGITAERKEAPLLRTVIAERNSGIVLNDGCAIGEDEVAHRRETAGMQEIGSALEETVSRRQRRTEFQEAAGLDAGVGQIGREIIQRLFDTIAPHKHDP